MPSASQFMEPRTKVTWISSCSQQQQLRLRYICYDIILWIILSLLKQPDVVPRPTKVCVFCVFLNLFCTTTLRRFRRRGLRRFLQPSQVYTNHEISRNNLVNKPHQMQVLTEISNRGKLQTQAVRVKDRNSFYKKQSMHIDFWAALWGGVLISEHKTYQWTKLHDQQVGSDLSALGQTPEQSMMLEGAEGQRRGGGVSTSQRERRSWQETGAASKLTSKWFLSQWKLPVGLSLLQEVHLLVHAGAGLELLHHHLGGVQASGHLPQQHLGRRRRVVTRPGCAGGRVGADEAGESCLFSGGAAQHRPPELQTAAGSRRALRSAHLPEPAAPDLLQVQQTVAVHLRRLEELGWRTERWRWFFTEAKCYTSLVLAVESVFFSGRNPTIIENIKKKKQFFSSPLTDGHDKRESP